MADSDSGFSGIKIDPPYEFQNDDLANELDVLISNVRRSYVNDEKFSRAQDALFIFNIGLLCGLRLGKDK